MYFFGFLKSQQKYCMILKLQFGKHKRGETMQTFAERLISLREDKGWKKKELAEKLHVSDSMISQYESGRCMTDSESGYSLSFTYSNG